VDVKILLSVKTLISLCKLVIISKYEIHPHKVIDETLSPTWDELLIIDEVIVYGIKEEMKTEPPMVVVEIFDQDKVVSLTQNVNRIVPVFYLFDSTFKFHFPFVIPYSPGLNRIVRFLSL